MSTFTYKELINHSHADIDAGNWHQVVALCEMIDRLNSQGRGSSDQERFFAYCVECAEASGLDLQGMIAAYRFPMDLQYKGNLARRLVDALPDKLVIFALSNVCLHALNVSNIEDGKFHFLRSAVALVQNWCICGEHLDRMFDGAMLCSKGAEKARREGDHSHAEAYFMMSFLLCLAWMSGVAGTSRYQDSLVAHGFTGLDDCVYASYGPRFEHYLATKCMMHSSAFLEQSRIAMIARRSVSSYAMHGERSFDMTLDLDDDHRPVESEPEVRHASV